MFYYLFCLERYNFNACAYLVFYNVFYRQIVNEYNDCVDRAQRLSEAKESMLCGGDGGVMCVKMEDMLIFLRWLVCHLHSLRTVHHYLRVSCSQLVNYFLSGTNWNQMVFFKTHPWIKFYYILWSTKLLCSWCLNTLVNNSSLFFSILNNVLQIRALLIKNKC